MRQVIYKKCTFEEKKKLTERSAIDFTSVNNVVKEIVLDVKRNGINAAVKYSQLYDGFNSKNLFVTNEELDLSLNQVDKKYIDSLKTAFSNILKFHRKQLNKDYELETMNGIKCSYKYLPIENVGIYVPGGTAILPSTILMLSAPAVLAGCKRILMITPCKGDTLDPKVLAAAKIAGISEIVKIGGAQGIALAAYGNSVLDKVDKIFGPGNKYVTAAKSIVSKDPEGCAIDMPAGPSEVLIIADKFARPDFIAADLLSQAEHGEDSQAILVTNSIDIMSKVNYEISNQLLKLKRNNLAKRSLENSFMLLVENLDQAIFFSNEYAPEHLIINTKNYQSLIEKIKNAGSVFLGPYSPESAGDYASGTNHSLPTYGFAKAYSGVSVRDFQKTISFQEISKEGLIRLSETIITIADAEELEAHANAVKIRVNYEN